MNEVYKRAYSEVFVILNLISYELKSKVPKKFLDKIENERDLNYFPEFKKDIPLENQNPMKETISILAVLKLNCWSTDEEKKDFIALLNENEKKFQKEKEMNEKYNSENLFKKNKTVVKQEERKNNGGTDNSKPINAVEKYKENIFIKVIKKIKLWLSKKE